jgi:uncharacterized membrane protein (DUF485 family)
MIFIGGIAMYLYLFLTYGFNPLLAVNYAIEVVSWGVIVAYHYKLEGPRLTSISDLGDN